MRQYIRNYLIYAKTKPAKNQQEALLPLHISQRSWNDLAVDLITKLPVFSDTCYYYSRHIWVITNRLAKEQHFVPCQDLTATHLARMFI